MANVKLQGTRTIPETVSVPETVVVEETIRILSERFELVDRWIRDGQGWKTKSTITARSRKKQSAEQQRRTFTRTSSLNTSENLFANLTTKQR